ncbi:lantibiotic dehydratase [Streptomyces sp. CBMA123]|uniref:lantibiotic dehydratase n=1 Tax=Streptomyces sp. CBMA123 TaxID=1896313 RepID=UPI00166213E5|nr:lantibiotic dehydratase [Streptomyces sp. CBMA123]MBD0695381.1 thiopeptide-type bacteriocin biosynthesis domain protein [Streptomyces sp. CBMA123]
MSRYVPADFFLLRAPALPVDTYHRITADPARTRAELLALAEDPEVRRALLVASEDLVAALERLDRTDERRARRLHSRLLRYLTRMSTRPTPFGAFAGVAMGEFGECTTARLGGPAIGDTRVRGDLEWLFALIHRLEGDQALLPHLDVVANSTAHLAGDRVVLPFTEVHGREDKRAVRIRATEPVRLVLRAAAAPVPYRRLVAELTDAFPAAGESAVTGLVRQLWELGFLGSDLRPPQTEARPEEYLLKKVTGLPGAEDVAEGLRAVVELTRTPHDVTGLRALSAAQSALVPEHHGRTYQLDATLDLRTPTLNRAVGVAAADAVDVLLRLAAASGTDHQHLARYREEFVERYGAGARVPVLEVLSADAGLDAPPLYTQPGRSFDLPPTSTPPDTARYDAALLDLAQEAWWERSFEVELTDARLDRLAPPGTTGAGPVLPVVDAYLSIEAADRDAIDRGEWRAVLRSDGMAQGGRTFGRFFDLLGDGAVERLRDYARREEELFPDAVHAELAFQPTWGRAANVAVRPRIRPYEIPVNSTPSVPPDRVVPLDDLLLGATEGRLYLWSRRLGREVVVAQHHMLSPLIAPDVARFLLEVSYDGYVLPVAFGWGRLARAPFLPRVVRGRVVLRPAQWRLTARDLADPAGWRARWNVPRHVYLVEDDNRLLLDLDHPQTLPELRAALTPGAALTFQELLPAHDRLWLTDGHGRRHHEEIVVPLIVRDAASAARHPAGGRTTAPVPRHLPGGEWSFLQVYAGPERQDEIITGPLPDLVAELRAEGLLDRWFHLRYADPHPHLRLRVRSADAPRTLARLLAWGRELVAQGLARDLAVASYTPEVARYGGAGPYDAVERLFEANSEATAALLARRPGLRPEPLLVGAVDLLYSQWGVPLPVRADLAPGGRTDEEAVRRAFRADRDYLCELLQPWPRRPHEEGARHRLLLAEAFAAQRPAAQAAAEAVRRSAAAGRLVGTERQILASLAHLQVNRLLPIDLAREDRAYGLWRHTLRAVRGRVAAEDGNRGTGAEDGR